jgi:hypothetical protein
MSYGFCQINCQLPNDGKANARRAIKSFAQTFSKGGWQPQPKKDGASELATPSELEQKLVFLASFWNL